MHFIEQNCTDTAQGWVLLQQAQKEPIGHQLHAGVGTNAAIEPHAIAHRFTNGFPQTAGHLPGGQLGGQTPRFQHQHPALAPRFSRGQGQRHPRGFARSRWGLQHQPAMDAQRLQQLRQQRLNRQRSRRSHGSTQQQLAARKPGD